MEREELYGSALNLADDAERFAWRHPMNSFAFEVADSVRKEALAVAYAADRDPFPAELVALGSRLSEARRHFGLVRS